MTTFFLILALFITYRTIEVICEVYDMIAPRVRAHLAPRGLTTRDQAEQFIATLEVV